MTLREEYQAKVARATKLLKSKKYTTRECVKSRQDLEHLKEVYEYRIESIDNLAKEKEEKLKRDQVNNYEEMLNDMDEEN